MIDVNPYILILQFVNFLLGLWIINNFIIAPIRKVLAKRKASIDSTQENISNILSNAKLKLDTYEKELRSSQLEAVSIRDDKKLLTEKLVGNTLHEANEQARKQVQEAYSTLLNEKDKAISSLNLELDSFVDLAAKKILA